MFDAAFYSLRSTLELFMLMVFFIEHKDIELTEHVKKWNNLEYMDTYSRMDKYLSENSELYINIKRSMSNYFESLKKLNNRLNKKVHKQSFYNLYANRIHPTAKIKFNFNNEEIFFEESLKKIIGAVIVFRLFIDPMPILLMDKEIFFRTKDTISGPLHEEFIDRYIGRNHIQDYKKCDLYQNHYESFLQEKKLNESVAYLIKYKTIDISKKDEIEAQYLELYEDDKLAFRIACESNEIYAIDVFNGITKYSTTNIPEKKQPYIRNMEHEKYFNLDHDIYNKTFEDVFISIFVVDEHQRIFIEQGAKLKVEKLNRIRMHIDKYVTKK
jgi:hypothetical protein